MLPSDVKLLLVKPGPMAWLHQSETASLRAVALMKFVWQKQAVANRIIGTSKLERPSILLRIIVDAGMLRGSFG